MANPFSIGHDLLKRLVPHRSKFVGDPYIAEAAVIVPSQFRNNPGEPGWFFGPNGIDYKFEYSDLHSATKAYRQCPPLAAVINRKAQAYINGRTVIVNTQGKEIKPTAYPGQLRRLLRQPNPLQSWKAFESQMYMNVQLFGFSICMPIYPVAYNKEGATQASSLWNIPSQMVTCTENPNLPWFKAGSLKDIVPTIQLKYKKLTITIPTDDLFIFKDFVPNFDSQVFPDSRVRALAMPVNNIIAAYESRNELINYAGSQGILTPETDAQGPIPMKEGEKEQLQSDFKRQYGIKKGQYRYIISPAAMKWQPMGKATKDLMLFEEITDDIMRICDGYGYPSPLLNSEKGPNVSNTDSYKKQVYEDTIIPESLDIYEQWNDFLKLGDTNLTIGKNYDHLPILQQDQVLEGQARLYLNQACLIEFQNGLITLNQWRIEQGIEPVPGDDLYFYQLGGRLPAPAKPISNGPATGSGSEEDSSESGTSEEGE